MRRILAVTAVAAVTASTALGLTSGSASAVPRSKPGPSAMGHFKHLVVIYEENHSFDNLFGGWGKVNGKSVNGIGSHGYAARSTQVDASGAPYGGLLQLDVNLTSPPLPGDCGTVTRADGTTADSHFTNSPFNINAYIAPEDKTCPPANLFAANGVLKDSPGALAGGCTRDIVHRFYNEQFQLHGGRMDRYTLGSDAAGLTQGYYDTKGLPVYEYLHGPGAPKYVVADHFFQGAFGGSFLNHQFLVAARAPVWTGWTPAAQAHSVLDANGMPAATPLYANPTPGDNALTQACPDPTVVFGATGGRACGDVAVNTVQPFSQPYSPGTADAKRLPAIDDAVYPNIGDELSAKGVSWNWYSGGWDNAAGNVAGPGWTNGSTPGICTDPDHKASDTYPYCAGNLFQFHHQPLNYFANFGEGQPGRAHLKDEQAFIAAVQNGALPSVSFVKPYGAENEHPGYASTENGEAHLVDLLQAIENGPQARNTLVVVTYDEFGGQWDHVRPPGQGKRATPGPHDVYGPSTRIPALVIGRSLKHSAVDSTSYDTTSILATIERTYHLKPLDATYHRDARVHDLSHALRAAGIRTR